LENQIREPALNNKTVKTALISFLENNISIRALSAYLKQNGFDAICIFCSNRLGENDFNALENILKKEKISLVGVTLATDDFQPAAIITGQIKKRLNIPVIWGGPHADISPQECLSYADMVCTGEGEDALLELARRMSTEKNLNTTIPNIWFKSDNKVITNEIRPLEENLDRLPFPDTDFETQYTLQRGRIEKLEGKLTNGIYSIMTSRGCPYACDYCYNSYRKKQFTGKGRYLRMRSVKHVIAELALAKSKFKEIKKIHFLDDSFLIRSRSDLEIFKEEYKKKIDLPFFVLSEAISFDKNKVQLLKDSGLSMMQVGLQTGSERVNREIYNRPVLNKDITELADIIKQKKIKVVFDIIFNNPYEKESDIAETIKLLLRLPKPFSLQGYNLIFYPGTELTKRAIEDGYISLRSDKDGFTGIQDESNSPLLHGSKAAVSNKFYKVNYGIKQNEYLNSLIILISFMYVPNALARFFLKKETYFKKILLRLIINQCFIMKKVIKFSLSPSKKSI